MLEHLARFIEIARDYGIEIRRATDDDNINIPHLPSHCIKNRQIHNIYTTSARGDGRDSPIMNHRRLFCRIDVTYTGKSSYQMIGSPRPSVLGNSPKHATSFAADTIRFVSR